jgi:hypothetical protein
MITVREIVVRFQKRAHNPRLMAAGFDKTDPPLPWLVKRRLHWSSGRTCGANQNQSGIARLE